jgi:hypothetical protein
MYGDLILSVVKNRSWRDLDCYAVSLARCGFEGKKVIFVEDVPQDAINNLQDLGFEVIPFVTVGEGLHFQTSRYNLAYEYLSNNWQHYRYAIWTDVCDLVFQRNPIPFIKQNLTGNNARLIAAKEGRLIKNEAINTVWIERLNLPTEKTAYLKEQEILCSGTIQGESGAVLGLFHGMRQKFGINDMQGMDQGIYNWAIREYFPGNMTNTPEMSEGFISTCGSFLSSGEGNNPSVWTVEPPYFDRETGLVMTADRSKPFCIAHQYNRAYGLYDPNGDWRSILERRYR